MYTQRSSVMEDVTRSNLKLCPKSRSRSVLREQALAAWRFQPSDTAKDQDADAAWIFQASQRDMEIVTRALERELNSRPDEGDIIGTSEKIAGTSTSEVASSSMSSCDPGSPSQAAVEAKASLELVSDSMAGQFEATGIRTAPAEALSRCSNNLRSVQTMNNFIGKRRSRRGNRAPITVMRADPADFQAMVQQMTGFPLENRNRAAASLLKPQPKRPGRIGSNIIPSDLPTLNSSSLGFPVAINGLFGTRPNYLNPASFSNNLAENSANSAGTATSTSYINSMGVDKVNSLQSQINAFAQRDFRN